MAVEKKTLETLHATSRRVTSQRQVVLEVVKRSPAHLDAEAIHHRARKKDPRISLATVYRALAVFKDIGLVQQSYLDRDHAREHYEPIGAPEHYHFTCLGCRNVIEFQSSRIAQMTADLHRQLGVSVAHACICLEGYCRTCATKARVSKE
ncbi:MAG: transcriptional repressor [Bacteroidetes bacterium]|nr:transcriptional repressor [Bacteroidota bacterium]